MGKGGSPIIRGGIGFIDCIIVGTYPAGDHTVFLGEVIDLSSENKRPLLYLDRKYVALPQSS
jgi:flavin reductase (DIM6/NTAB) family NADH-FMN oxidoreductase RutF